MTDQKENTVSVKIFESTRDALEKEKMRFKTKERPDYAEIIAPAIDLYLSKPGVSQTTTAYSAISIKQKKGTGFTKNDEYTEHGPHAKWIAMLMDILESDHSVAIGAVLSNIVAFHELVRRGTGATTRDADTFKVPDDFARTIAEFRRYAKQLEDARKNARKRGSGSAG